MRFRRILCAVPFVFATNCTAAPEPQPEADPEPEAIAEPQTFTNNAPFSGAIYIVDPNGQPVQAQGSNMCPTYASLNCGDQGHPSWCCPGGYSCVASQNSNGYVGCCPAGSNCAQAVVASVSTVTVYQQAPTSVVYVQPHPEPTTPVVVQGTPYTQQVVQGGFCSTLTMNSPDLPRVTQGACGTILIVNQASRSLKPVGYSIAGVFVLAHLGIARVFRWI